MLWNTIYVDAALNQLRSEGFQVGVIAESSRGRFHDDPIPLSAYALPDVRLQIPTLTAAAREVAKESPHGQLVECTKVGHVPHLEVATAFQNTVQNFLGR